MDRLVGKNKRTKADRQPIDADVFLGSLGALNAAADEPGRDEIRFEMLAEERTIDQR
ncbi:MAG: hypothetical protein ACYDH3_09180 [Candidatus Aminicenantales bacterium]